MTNERAEGIPDLSAVEPATPTTVAEKGSPSASPMEIQTSPSQLPVLVLKSTAEKVVGEADVKPEHVAQLDNIRKLVDFDDSNSIVSFGIRPQEKLQAKLKTLLEGVKVKDLGQAGDLVLQLAGMMDYLKVDELKAEIARQGDDDWKSFMAGLPLIGRLFSKVNLYLERRKEIVDKLSQLELNAKAERRRIIEDIARLDELFRGIEGNYYELGVYIVAGEKALEAGRAGYEQARAAAGASGNPLAISKVVSFHENLMAFDDTLLELKMAYVRAPMTGQRIRLIQRTGRDQVRKITHDLLFTMTQLMEGLIQLNTLLDIGRSQAGSKAQAEAAARIGKFADEMLTLTTETAHRNRLDVLTKVEEIEAGGQKVLELMKRRQEMDREVAEANRQADSMLLRIQSDFREGLKAITREAVAGQERPSGADKDSIDVSS